MTSRRSSLVFALVYAATTAVAHATENIDTISHLKQLNVEDLLDVEVTSVSRHASPLAQAPSAIQVITQAQIRRSGATTLAEVLRLADNLQVAQRGARGWAISARGFNTDLANKLLVMIDGRTVYTPLYSGVFWEAQDYLLEDIERIEVISGPGGTLWGANAVNGVINIITKRTADTQGLYAEGGSGSEMDAIAGLRYGGTLTPDVSYRVYGKYLDYDQSVLPDGSGAGDAWRRRQAGFRMDGAHTTAGNWTVQGDYYSNHEQVPTGGTTTMEGENLLGRWNHALADDSGLSLQLYYDRTFLSLAVPPLMLGNIPLTAAGTLRDELQTFDLDFQHRLRINDANTFTWGLGFRDTHDVVDNAPAIAFLPEVLDQQLYSAFLQDEIRLREGLSLTVGTKVEHNDYTGYEFEPSLRVQWQAAATQTVWAAVSRAIRAPSRIDRDLNEAPVLTILKGSEDFHSEKVLAYELGWRAQASARLTTSLATFYNNYDDVRSTAITPATILPFYFQNGVKGHTWGAEWTGALQLTDDWSLHAGYVLLQEKLRVKPGETDLTNARNEVADPQQQASLHSSLDLPRRVTLDLGLRWVDTVRNSNGQATGRVPAYLDLNANLSWHATANLELALTGANLLHDQHPEYGFPLASRSEVERSVYAKLVWRR
ncbi:MAG: TonB-dependent receptor [Pseudomonadota bacterium]